MAKYNETMGIQMLIQRNYSRHGGKNIGLTYIKHILMENKTILFNTLDSSRSK